MSRVDLKMSGGTTFRRRFYVYQRDGATIVGDLTGYAVTLTMSLTADSAALYTFAGTIVTAASALCSVEVSPLEVDTITDGTYWYRINVDAGSQGYKPLEGFISKVAA